MNIEDTQRVIRVVEKKLDTTDRAIASLINLAEKFESTMCKGTAKLLGVWKLERAYLTAKVSELNRYLEITKKDAKEEQKKTRHLSIIA